MELQKDPEERIEALQGIVLDNLTIEPGIISFRNFKDQLISSPLEFSEGESEASFIQESNALIKHWVDELVSEETVFEKTANLDQCTFCDFTSICHRNV
jgi:hypothetical protein